MLTSIWASNSEESKRMKKVAPVAVFSFKDRHSDELCYQTISQDLEQILQETKDVLTSDIGPSTVQNIFCRSKDTLSPRIQHINQKF
ncbi:hypothetical protein ACROYT_G015656 [Oculina patagonica]